MLIITLYFTEAQPTRTHAVGKKHFFLQMENWAVQGGDPHTQGWWDLQAMNWHRNHVYRWQPMENILQYQGSYGVYLHLVSALRPVTTEIR